MRPLVRAGLLLGRPRLRRLALVAVRRGRVPGRAVLRHRGTVGGLARRRSVLGRSVLGLRVLARAIDLTGPLVARLGTGTPGTGRLGTGPLVLAAAAQLPILAVVGGRTVPA